MNNQAPAVVVDGLRVFWGSSEVLPGISLSVPRGQVVGLLGPGDSGRTTLLRSIVGVQIVAGGTVTVLGEPGSPTSSHGRSPTGVPAKDQGSHRPGRPSPGTG